MLKVSAPFHCALMKPAQERLALDLDQTEFSDLRVPLVNNAEARLVHSGAEAREGLKRQVTLPVRWEQSVQLLRSENVGTFVEVGPGKVLSGLLRDIDRRAECLHVEDAASLREVAGRLASPRQANA
jgi:[acyl-carrier-protein] S-malonyltransferase